MDIIKVSNLYKNYINADGKILKAALRGIDITIKKGSIFGLLGPNGAGKSTFINILAGLIHKDQGEVLIDNIDIDIDPRETRYRLGIVPQELALDPFFSVRETLELYAGYFAVPKKMRRTDEILAALSLSDKAHLSSRNLSGGMKRRLLIAKALVHNPKILILDEPTAGVDVGLRKQLWDYVRELNSRGTTIILTTHYLEEAELLCDHIAIINHGKIIANDATSNLLHIIDRKQINITFKESFSEIPMIFRELKNVDIKLNENIISFTWCKKMMQTSHLLEAIYNSKLEVTDLVTEEPDLEEVFNFLIKND